MAEQQPDVTAAALAAVYDAKALAELADAESAGGSSVRGWRGEPLGPLAFVVSAMSAEGGEESGPLSGEAGDAADKAAAGLGAGSGPVFIVASRPSADIPEPARARRLALMLEAADPRVVIALDAEAAKDLALASGMERLDEPGLPVLVRGRVLGSAGGFVASLGDRPAKLRVWTAMKRIASAGGLKAAKRPKAPRDERPDGAA
jgi:hypothetical protein